MGVSVQPWLHTAWCHVSCLAEGEESKTIVTLLKLNPPLQYIEKLWSAPDNNNLPFREYEYTQTFCNRERQLL
jgi:hypothetical protein